ETLNLARQLASAFAEMGLKAGDVVSFQLPNWVETMIINLAAGLSGIVVNPIVPIYRESEVRYILRDARAKVFLIPHHFRNFDYTAMAARLRGEVPSLEHLIVVRSDAQRLEEEAAVLAEDAAADGSISWEALLARGRPEQAPAGQTDANAVKLLLYTSGTTGQAKGVLHSHNTIMAEIEAVIDFWGITDRDVSLMPSPVTHITGYLYALEICFAAGVKVVLMERWNANDALDLIETHGVTFSVGATPFLKELTD